MNIKLKRLKRNDCKLWPKFAWNTFAVIIKAASGGEWRLRSLRLLDSEHDCRWQSLRGWAGEVPRRLALCGIDITFEWQPRASTFKFDRSWWLKKSWEGSKCGTMCFIRTKSYPIQNLISVANNFKTLGKLLSLYFSCVFSHIFVFSGYSSRALHTGSAEGAVLNIGRHWRRRAQVMPRQLRRTDCVCCCF